MYPHQSWGSQRPVFHFFIIRHTLVCSVQCSICSMKYTCSESGAFTGVSAVRNVHCAECSVLPDKDEYLAVETGCFKKIILRNNF